MRLKLIHDVDRETYYTLRELDDGSWEYVPQTAADDEATARKKFALLQLAPEKRGKQVLAEWERPDPVPEPDEPPPGDPAPESRPN